VVAVVVVVEVNNTDTRAFALPSSFIWHKTGTPRVRTVSSELCP